MQTKKILLFSFISLLLIAFLGSLYHYRRQIYRQTPFYKRKIDKEFDQFFAQWKVYGIDVSEYQGDIDWDEVSTIFGEHQIHFVFIRATAGKDKVDAKFAKNWKAQKKPRILQGAYHYYRPDENSIAQAGNFIAHVKLKKGNLPPVLDIEQISTIQSLERLKTGLHKWLNKVEKHYGVKPIIYSGSSYFTKYLKREFKDYTLWVANYNRTKVPVRHDWKIWQYSDKGRVKGIDGKVDINVFDGTVEELKSLTIK